MKELAGEPEEFPRRKLIVQEWKVRHIGEALTHLNGLGLHIVSAHLGGAGGGGNEADQHLDGGGFTGGIRAEHSEKFAFADRETQVIDGGQVAEFLHEMGQFDH